MEKPPVSRLFAIQAEKLLKEGNPREAIKLCEEGLAAYPDYATAFVILSRAYFERKMFPQAFSIIRKGIEKFPLNPVLLKTLEELENRQIVDYDLSMDEEEADADAQDEKISVEESADSDGNIAAEHEENISIEEEENSAETENISEEKFSVEENLEAEEKPEEEIFPEEIKSDEAREEKNSSKEPGINDAEPELEEKISPVISAEENFPSPEFPDSTENDPSKEIFSQEKFPNREEIEIPEESSSQHEPLGSDEADDADQSEKIISIGSKNFSPEKILRDPLPAPGKISSEPPIPSEKLFTQHKPERHSPLRIIETVKSDQERTRKLLKSSNMRLIPGLEFTPLRFEGSKKHSRLRHSLPEPPAFRAFKIAHRHKEVSASSMFTRQEQQGYLPASRDPGIFGRRDKVAGTLTPLEELAFRLEQARIPVVHEEPPHRTSSSAGEPMMVSETMARIYEKQGAYSEALKAYLMLAQQRPEKKEYYDQKIQELKEKVRE